MNAPAHGDQPLDAVLRPIHDRWSSNARRFLEPALEAGADHWTRWAAVRYLADDFRDQFGWERDLLDELRPFIDRERAERLTLEGARVARLALELDRVGRRRGTAEEFAAGTRALLAQLGLWCAELERAGGGVSRQNLPAEGTALLAHLEAMTQLRR
jgi:hypothetical protein